MATVSAISDTLGLAGLAELAKDGHKPDKLYTWKYAPESDGWFRIHNALRGEMFKFKAVLEKLASTPLEPWQVSALQTYWQGHSALVHDHHDHEDKLFTPMIKTRCEYPEKLEADHDELVALMEEITGIVDEQLMEEITGIVDGIVDELRAGRLQRYSTSSSNTRR